MVNKNTFIPTGVLGWPHATVSNIAVTTLTSALIQNAIAFAPSKSEIVNEVSVYLNALSGTIASNDLSCEIFSSTPESGATTNLVPNASLGTASVTLAAPAAGSSVITFTGLSISVTAGVQYFAVFTNLNAVPGVNNVAIAIAPNYGVIGQEPGQSGLFGTTRFTVNGGTSWSNGVNPGAPSALIKYSDASYDGFIIQSGLTEPTDFVYGTREIGVKFTTSANIQFNLDRIVMQVVRLGSPTGNMRYRIYEGTTLMATSQTFPAVNLNTGKASFPLNLATTFKLKPSTVYRVTMGETTQSDSSGDHITSAFYTIPNDSNIKAKLPFQGTLQKTYFDGSVWVDTDTMFPPFTLISFTDPPFAPIGYAFGGS